MEELIAQHWEWFIAVLVPAVAVVVDQVVKRFGSQGAKEKWAKAKGAWRVVFKKRDKGDS